MIEGLTFGGALAAVKEGKCISREGWNDKGMFVFMRPEDELQKLFLIDAVKSLPASVKSYFASNTKETQVKEKVKFTAYLCLKAADDSIVNGWNASQVDMLADDWCVLDY